MDIEHAERVHARLEIHRAVQETLDGAVGGPDSQARAVLEALDPEVIDEDKEGHPLWRLKGLE